MIMDSTSPQRELNIALCGDVDAGKSTAIGVLTNNALDNGNGSARLSVLSLKHELDSGKTSNVNTVTVKYGNQDIRFLDLAGHEAYMGTTLQGLTRFYPDVVFLLIAANRGISKTTKDHVAICKGLNLPIIILISKIDSTPEHIIKDTFEKVKTMCRSRGVNKKCELLL